MLKGDETTLALTMRELLGFFQIYAHPSTVKFSDVSPENENPSEGVDRRDFLGAQSHLLLSDSYCELQRDAAVKKKDVRWGL